MLLSNIMALNNFSNPFFLSNQSHQLIDELCAFPSDNLISKLFDTGLQVILLSTEPYIRSPIVLGDGDLKISK